MPFHPFSFDVMKITEFMSTMNQVKILLVLPYPVNRIHTEHAIRADKNRAGEFESL